MKNMVRGFLMDGHSSLGLTSLSLLYRFVNVLHIWNLFFLLYTFWHEWSKLVTLCNELLHNINFDLYTVLTLFIFYSNFTAEHILTRMVTPSKALLRIAIYYQFWSVYRLYDSFRCNLIQSHSFSHSLHLD
jgi:hypothetical protein